MIILQLIPQKETVPVPSDKRSLAIVYFENISRDESLDNWRSGIPELLITDLSQSKHLYVLPGDRIYSKLRRLAFLEAKKYASEDLAKVMDQGRVTYVLKGSFVKAGDNFHITIMLQKPDTGEIISSTKVECRGEVEIPAVAYRAKGLYDKAREVIENYCNNFRDFAGHRWDLTMTYLCQGKYDLARVEKERFNALKN